jgi:lysine 2,3-aminomutase
VFLELVRKLVRIRVRPYYVYQAQTLSGTGHFVTTIEEGLAIMQGLRGWTTGFAVPQYVLDTPYGKIPLNHQYIRGREGDYVEMESWSGKMWREWNPVGKEG